MAFILAKDRRDSSAKEWKQAWLAYSAYLDSISDSLPKHAYEYAIAEWHYNFESHKSPHDAWLDVLTIAERPKADTNDSRFVEIQARLLGAYHDGIIEITYHNVKSYSLSGTLTNPGGHLDFHYDEVRLSENGHALHEVEWSSGCAWIIECEDIVYDWLPFDLTDVIHSK